MDNYVWETLQKVVENSQEPTIVVIVENPDITFTKEYENTLYQFKTQLETEIVFTIYLKDAPESFQEMFKKEKYLEPFFFGYEPKSDFSNPKYFLDGIIMDIL
jgi:hypothetical protein